MARCLRFGIPEKHTARQNRCLGVQLAWRLVSPGEIAQCVVRFGWLGSGRGRRGFIYDTMTRGELDRIRAG